MLFAMPKLKTRIMYIESKATSLNGVARNGRVSYSKTGRTLYYGGKEFRSLNGRGFKANYYEMGSGTHYWISGCRRDGSDRLYDSALPVEVDEDVREEYWTTIRGLPAPRVGRGRGPSPR